MVHIAPFKKRIVNNLVKLFKSYPIIGCLDMENLPAPQLQQMKAQLRDKVVMAMTKRRLMKIAIEQCKDVKGIEKIKEYLLGMPALLFTKEDPFKLSKTIQKSKSFAPAKPGQIAPKDLTINAGPTPFSPGPIIGELSKLGLKTSVEANKIVIKEDKVMVKKGETIKSEVASILSRLDIKPMEIGLNLVAILENGEIIPKEVLTVSEEEYIQRLQQAYNWAFNLSIEIGIVNKDNIEFLISKAFNEAKTLALEGNIISDVVVKEMLSKAERQALNIKEEGKIEIEIIKKEEKIEKKEEIKEEKKEAVKKEIKKEEVTKKEKKVEEKEIIKEEPEEAKKIDKKVSKMVEKAKDFAKGKKVTADDILKEEK